MPDLPRIVLREWPAPATGVVGTLDTIDADKLEALRARLPRLSGGCWAVAQGLCGWVATRWQHDGTNDVDELDAVELLDRAGRGERFRCVEYGIVLAQGLNALGIPARWVHALRAGYDRPQTGMGHVVVEAWMDDLDKWVVIDGQNQAYWRDDEHGLPLSAAELWRRHRTGAPRPQFVDVTGTVVGEEQTAEWWQYFAGVGIGGSALADDDGFALVFQGRHMLHRDRVLTDPAGCYPRLSSLTVGCTWAADGVPGLRLTSAHPYAQALCVDGRELPDDSVVPLTLEPGEHTISVGTVTAHGTGASFRIRYDVQPNPAG